jgi:hypothetical protein
LLKLGIEISEPTVSRLLSRMFSLRNRARWWSSQKWVVFIIATNVGLLKPASAFSQPGKKLRLS